MTWLSDHLFTKWVPDIQAKGANTSDDICVVLLIST
jgi:hypothetical protein